VQLGVGEFASPEDAVKFIHDIAPLMVPEAAVEVVCVVMPDWLREALAFYDLDDIGSKIRRHVDIPEVSSYPSPFSFIPWLSESETTE
jgi:hypothetical protein